VGGSRKSDVKLHLYDMGSSGTGATMNCLLGALGTGAFHCGVEVYQEEWSFGGLLDPMVSPTISGVFVSKPQQCVGHSFSKTIDMGLTSVSEFEVTRLLRALQPEYMAVLYDTVRHNCGHFCNDFCLRLGVGRIPTWVNQLAATGANAQSNVWEMTDPKCCQAMAGEAQRQLCSVELDSAQLQERVVEVESDDGEEQDVGKMRPVARVLQSSFHSPLDI